MIKVTILYPNGPDVRFDMDYYAGRHMPMVQRKCGAACRSIAVDQGVSGPEPGSKATYVAIGYLTFDSVESFRQAFSPHAREIMADITNYSSVTPIIQISDVRL